MRRLAAVLGFAFVSLVACEGPMGPEGPQGPQGDPGPEGPAGQGALVLDGTGQLDVEGSGGIELPAELVDDVGLPTVSCWVSSNGEAWLSVDHSPNTEGTPFCGLTGIGTESPAVVLLSSAEYSEYFFVIVVVF